MNLQQFFEENPKVALAFSGGVDSAYLMYAAKTYGADVKAYYVNAAFQPAFELEDATRLATQLQVPMEILTPDILAEETVVSNPSNRCYFCKKVIFGNILEAAKKDGYTVILDGTNASDDAGDRPGMRVLQELQVRSPLRECGLTKSEIRERSKEAGLFTWDKPAYACLATRIPSGTRITKEDLERTEKGEQSLQKMGFRDFRIRLRGENALIQVTEAQLPLALEKRQAIVEELLKYYKGVALDMEVRG